MTRKISALDAGSRFADLLGTVASTKEPVIVEEDGRPVAVLISPEQWDAMERRRERAWATIEALGKRNAHLDPDEVLADVTAEVEAVRQEMYEERQRTDPRRD